MRVKKDEYDDFISWCQQNGYKDVVIDDKAEGFDLREYLFVLNKYSRERVSNKSPWLTLKEAASRIKVTPDTLSNYISRGLFPYCKSMAGTKRFHIEDVDRWLSEYRFGPDSGAGYINK